jgi:glycosyltransferase involved in cell wall biosynthesis
MTNGSNVQPSTRRGADATPLVTIVIPALNEERNLPEVLSKLPTDVEVILVDGGSVDRTVEVARSLRPAIRIINQTRCGKGNALACGFAASSGDIIVMIDADGSNDPAEIPRFVEAVNAGADFAKGSRFRAGGNSFDITPLRRLGNQGLNSMVNTLFGTKYTDLCYGYNAFHRSVLDHLDLPATAWMTTRGTKLRGDGFEIETMINIRVAAAGLQIDEIASVEAARHYGDSNLHAVRDGLRVLRTIVTEYARKVSTKPTGARITATQHSMAGTPAKARPLTPAAPSAEPVRSSVGAGSG